MKYNFIILILIIIITIINKIKSVDNVVIDVARGSSSTFNLNINKTVLYLNFPYTYEYGLLPVKYIQSEYGIILKDIGRPYIKDDIVKYNTTIYCYIGTKELNLNTISSSKYKFISNQESTSYFPFKSARFNCRLYGLCYCEGIGYNKEQNCTLGVYMKAGTFDYDGTICSSAIKFKFEIFFTILFIIIYIFK